MEENDILTETPEEKVFFDTRGAESKAEPEPVEAKEPEPEIKEAPKKPDTVPLATFLEQKNEFKTRFAQQEARLAKLQDFVNSMAPREEPEPINVQADPIKAIEALNNKIEQFETRDKTQAELAAIAQFGQRHAQEFAQKNTDFYDAYNHLRNSRANQLVETGRVTSAEELNQTILREEQNIIQLCASMNINPAQFMYNLAQTAGYAKAAPVAQAPSQEEKIKTVVEAQARATAPIKSNGGSSGPLDLKALMSLSDEEFDKATSGKQWKSVWN